MRKKHALGKYNELDDLIRPVHIIRRKKRHGNFNKIFDGNNIGTNVKNKRRKEYHCMYGTRIKMPSFTLKMIP